MVFANISIEGWVIDPYEQSLFDCSGKVLVLPSNYAEVVNVSFMTWDVTVVMNGRGGLLMFFEPFCKGPCRRRKKNICAKPYKDADIHFGPSTEQK